MKTRGGALLAAWVAAALWLPGGVAQAQSPAVRPIEIAPQVWLAQGVPALGNAQNRNYISNAAFVVTPQGVVVVDALGAPVLARELLASIATVTPLPVRYVVVTHYHADHVYGLQVFKSVGAQIVAHAAGRAYLTSDTAAQRLAASRQEMAPWIDDDTRLVAADRWIERGETLELGGVSFRIDPVGPAHTPEDLAVFLPAQGILFAGDLVFRNRIPFVGQADSGNWIKALEGLLNLKPRLIVPGHGPVSRDASADLSLTRDYLVHLRQAMGEAARNLEPFDEAYARADWSRYAALPLFAAANRINAYNTYLLMESSGR